MTAFELVATLGLDSTAFESGLDGAAKKASGIGGTIGKGLGAVASAGAAALTAATGAAVAFGKSAVDAGASFDSSMSQVAATMGTTVDQIGDLRDFAQQMGATTSFSATQAADALNYMALAGYDAETSMKMLPTVLDLAAAGGMDLASASDMVTDTQSALGLSLEETMAMVDQMAKASSKTNTSVSQLGDAMLTIGATARGVKGGTKELSTVLGVLADNGIKASEGGTHLRNILLSLQTETTSGVGALGMLGMTYQDFYDEAGNMRELPEIFFQLQQAMEGMTQQSKDAIISGIFNKTDLAAVNSLIGTSADRWLELDEAIGNADNAAKDMAATLRDNLAGDKQLFDSALEGMQIAVSDKLTPTLREFVQLGTQALSDMTLGFKENGLEGAADAFGNFLSDGVALIAEKLPVVVEAGARVLGAVIQGITENIPMLTTAATDIAVNFANLLIQNVPSLLDAGVQMLGGLASGIGQALPELVPAAVEAVLSLCDTLINNAPQMVDAGISLLTGLGEGLINALPMLIEKIPEIIQALVRALIMGIPKIAEAGGKLIGSLFENLPKILPSLLKGIGTLLEAILEGVLGGTVSMVYAGVQLIAGIGKGIIDGAVAVIESAKRVAGNILSAIKGFFGIHSPSTVMEKEVGVMIPRGIEKGMQDEYGSLQRTTDEMSSIISPEVAPTVQPGQAGPSRVEEILLQIVRLMESMGITIDGKVLAGYLTPYIDSELGRVYSNRRREATYV